MSPLQVHTTSRSRLPRDEVSGQVAALLQEFKIRSSPPSNQAARRGSSSKRQGVPGTDRQRTRISRQSRLPVVTALGHSALKAHDGAQHSSCCLDNSLNQRGVRDLDVLSRTCDFLPR